MAGLERVVSVLLRFLFTDLVWWFASCGGGFGWYCVVWLCSGVVCDVMVVGFGGWCFL